MNNIGNNLARQRERFIQRQGSDVQMPDGTTRKAMIHHSDHDLLRNDRSEGDGPEKVPLVLVFGGSTWGHVLENSKVTIGVGAMQRDFIVATPLHPKWRQTVVTELAVVAFPDQ